MQAGAAMMEISMEGSQKFKDMHNYVTWVHLFWNSSYRQAVINIIFCSTFLSWQEMESVSADKCIDALWNFPYPWTKWSDIISKW